MVNGIGAPVRGRTWYPSVVGLLRTSAGAATLVACALVLGSGSGRAAAQPPAGCRTACVAGEVYDESTRCCVTAPDLADAERRARAEEALAVPAARAELDAAIAADDAAADAQDFDYRTLIVAGTFGFLTNYARIDHPAFLGEVARSSTFRLSTLFELSMPVLRRESDRWPLLSFEASLQGEMPVSYIGSFLFTPGLRGELRLRALYFAPLVFSEVDWISVRLHAISTEETGPRVRGRASSAGFGASIGEYGKTSGIGWIATLRWGPLIDGGRTHVSGELRVYEEKQLWEIYFRGFDELGEFTNGFWIGLAYGVTR